VIGEHIKRAPGPLIPTGNFSLSIGVGALSSFVVLLTGTALSIDLYDYIIVVLPFLTGFVANIVYGGVERGRRHILPVAVCSFLLFYCPLLTGLFFGFWNLGLESPVVTLLWYLSVILPPIHLIPAVSGMVGGVFGWLFALAIQR